MMKEYTDIQSPTTGTLIHLVWSLLWRTIGIASLFYFAVGLILVGLFYVAFVWCHAPLSIGKTIEAHFKLGLFAVFAISSAISPVLAFKMMIGKRFGKYVLTLVATPEQDTDR
ncbi:MAG: hypothetical protein KJ964_04630 [Verrucomicrobia bacterium]|nr:hypothetical protein [Verrucomicrobiota bacterium]MBU1733696.1 hypothetical protein [Verrucomicrobiota bacterium]MBU1858059.1 hypothetical protein [Verrucomicrobiota bacterium]